MTDTVRPKAEIEAELAAARVRLADSVESLFLQVHPKAVLADTVSEVKGFAASGVKAVRAELTDSRGNLRMNRIGLIAAAVAGSIAFLATIRSIRAK